jgi:hypothetical protein
MAPTAMPAEDAMQCGRGGAGRGGRAQQSGGDCRVTGEDLR